MTNHDDDDDARAEREDDGWWSKDKTTASKKQRPSVSSELRFVPKRPVHQVGLVNRESQTRARATAKEETPRAREYL